MIVYIPTVDAGGASNFLTRLTAAMGRMKSVSVTSSPHTPHDVSLHNAWFRKDGYGSKRVIRFDGAYFNTLQDYNRLNFPMKSSITYAHGVVFQSEFSKKVIEHFVGTTSGNIEVIPNGIDPNYVASIPPMKTEYEHNFAAVAQWRPHKRERDAIESFLLADIPNACLWVAGNRERSNVNPDDYKKHKNIKFLPHLSTEKVISLFKACTASLHLCWLDYCPNSVIEALISGCPVISNNISGTPELLKQAEMGYICKIDAPFKLHPVNLYDPPCIDRSIVAEAIHTSINNQQSNDKAIEAFSIFNIAKKYERFLRYVSKSRD